MDSKVAFFSSYDKPKEVSASDRVFVIQDDKVLVEDRGGRARVPAYAEVRRHTTFQTAQYLGTLNGAHCYAGAIAGEDGLPDVLHFRPIRSLFGELDDAAFWTAARALHLVSWDLKTKFCAACGGPVEMDAEDRAKRCTRCRKVHYPTISPSIITAVSRGNELLLLNHQRSSDDLYVLLAGFVEPGETLEEAVMRECLEETGIIVRDIRYFGSQPWAFTQALMVGFTAEYESGEIVPQASEIRDARWFKARELSEVLRRLPSPANFSITWRMIKQFEEAHDK